MKWYEMKWKQNFQNEKLIQFAFSIIIAFFVIVYIWYIVAYFLLHIQNWI